MNAKAACILAASEGIGMGATVVEIGCIRMDRELGSEGYSTRYLAERAQERDWRFYSVDVDPEAIRRAKLATQGLPVMFHCEDGEAFLTRFQHEIDFLYLDGDISPAQALNQYKAAPLADRAVVVIDDCQPVEMYRNGKASILIDVLPLGGFTVEAFPTEPGYAMLVATR